MAHIKVRYFMANWGLTLVAIPDSTSIFWFLGVGSQPSDGVITATDPNKGEKRFWIEMTETSNKSVEPLNTCMHTFSSTISVDN